MEMTSGCLRPQSACPPARPVRGPHGGWQKHEIDALQKSIDEAAGTGESLRSVFERLSAQLGRKPNSIRNFYYAQVRDREEGAMGRALPFETFTSDEVETLIERVLTARAQGMSVRACVRNLAGGDHTRMLRYQNKYRSTIRTRPELVRRVMDRLSSEGIPFVSPYADDADSQEYAMSGLQRRAGALGDPQLSSLLASLEHLVNLAYAPREAPPESPVAAESEDRRRADRLSARCDMLRIALDDEQTRMQQLRGETEGMVTLIKEYIALPESDRMAHASLFCQQAAARLSAVECALMQP